MTLRHPEHHYIVLPPNLYGDSAKFSFPQLNAALDDPRAVRNWGKYKLVTNLGMILLV